MGQIENKWENGLKPKHINNLCKHKWCRHSNQKAEIVRPDQIKNHDATMCGLQEIQFKYENTNRLKIKEQIKISTQIIIIIITPLK